VVWSALIVILCLRQLRVNDATAPRHFRVGTAEGKGYERKYESWRVCSLSSNLTGLPVFLLPDGCPICRVPHDGEIPYTDENDVTAAKLAIDLIEQTEVASAAFDLELRPDQRV
jgi:hypothetical protein